jgi:hypothetical protein
VVLFRRGKLRSGCGCGSMAGRLAGRATGHGHGRAQNAKRALLQDSGFSAHRAAGFGEWAPAKLKLRATIDLMGHARNLPVTDASHRSKAVPRYRLYLRAVGCVVVISLTATYSWCSCGTLEREKGA